MNDPAARQQAFQSLLRGPHCTQIASVFDPVSARLAQAAGFRGGFLSGSMTSAVVHGAPDVGVLTLTELAEQVRRTARASDLPLLVDGDHGYGNALNVIWAVRELEAAGAAAMTIEDLVAPQPLGVSEDRALADSEFEAKLVAAVAARRSDQFAIVGQTIIASVSGEDALVQRARLIEAAGCDAVMIYKVGTAAALEAVADAVSLPLILAPLAPQLNDPDLLRRCRVRISFLGHQAFRAAVAAMHSAYLALLEDNTAARAAAMGAEPELLRQALRRDEVATLMRDFLHAELD